MSNKLIKATRCKDCGKIIRPYNHSGLCCFCYDKKRRKEVKLK